jgi:hypothetical protein
VDRSSLKDEIYGKYENSATTGSTQITPRFIIKSKSNEMSAVGDGYRMTLPFKRHLTALNENAAEDSLA